MTAIICTALICGTILILTNQFWRDMSLPRSGKDWRNPLE